MRVIFELSMPNNNAWNGQWSGANNEYTVARNIDKKKFKEITEDSYYYNFGDGWCACVSVRVAKPRERVTNKFCGYDWMVDSIVAHNEIVCRK